MYNLFHRLATQLLLLGQSEIGAGNNSAEGKRREKEKKAAEKAAGDSEVLERAEGGRKKRPNKKNRRVNRDDPNFHPEDFEEDGEGWNYDDPELGESDDEGKRGGKGRRYGKGTYKPPQPEMMDQLAFKMMNEAPIDYTALSAAMGIGLGRGIGQAMAAMQEVQTTRQQSSSTDKQCPRCHAYSGQAVVTCWRCETAL